MKYSHPLQAGLGLRRGLLQPLQATSIKSTVDATVDFMEVAPENWMSVGGRLGRQFASYTERFPFFCHGLSLSIGSPAPLDFDFLNSLKEFLDQHNIIHYSEHLSYCGDEGHLYDLLPIPFTEEAIKYVASRVRQVQDVLERPLILENVSAYAQPGAEMTELEFYQNVVNESDAKMLLDINNVYVNSVNHGYDPIEFITRLDSNRIVYHHVAGHYEESDSLLVDTHGSAVKDDVWKLLEVSYQVHGVKPTLLERDFNIPSVDSLLSEVNKIKTIQYQVDSFEGAQLREVID